jgi:hypothetical protein
LGFVAVANHWQRWTIASRRDAEIGAPLDTGITDFGEARGVGMRQPLASGHVLETDQKIGRPRVSVHAVKPRKNSHH